MSKLIRMACLALLGMAGHAWALPQSSDQAMPAGPDFPSTASTAAPTIQHGVAQVRVSGARADDTEARRLSTAAKMVFGREELERNGDTSVSEVLKRLPGVTLGGPPGRGGGGVRMRGMGNGYTQMLVNGERPPPGFSLESLSPDQVERIEVIRGPVAEHSTQAIAGTINIVLPQLRLSANNLDPRVYETARSLDNGPLVQSAATLARTYRTLGIRYEMKL